MDEQHVGMAVPVADITNGERRASDRLARQINAADAPSVGLVMIQIKLVWPAVALVRCRCRRLKRNHVGCHGRRQSQKIAAANKRTNFRTRYLPSVRSSRLSS